MLNFFGQISFDQNRRGSSRSCRYLYRVILLLIVLAMITGCAKFAATKSANLTPFADQTLAVIGDMEAAWTRTAYVHLDDYVNEDDKDIQRLAKLRQQLNPLFRAIIAYSIQLVALSEANITEQEKAASLADFVEALQKPVMQQQEVKLQVTKEQFEEVLASMRKQVEFIDALAAAVPLINEISRYGGEIISEMQTSLEAIGRNIDGAIDERFKDVSALVDILENRQNVMIQGLKLSQGYHIGQTDILDELRALPIAGYSTLVPSGQLTVKEMDAITLDLVGRLRGIREAFDLIDINVKVRRASKDELQGALEEKRGQLRKARLFLIVWSRAYHKMASGITNPAEWFDVKSAPSELIKMGTKVIF